MSRFWIGAFYGKLCFSTHVRNHAPAVNGLSLSHRTRRKDVTRRYPAHHSLIETVALLELKDRIYCGSRGIRAAAIWMCFPCLTRSLVQPINLSFSREVSIRAESLSFWTCCFSNSSTGKPEKPKVTLQMIESAFQSSISFSRAFDLYFYHSISFSSYLNLC